MSGNWAASLGALLGLVALTTFLWRSWKLLRPGTSSDGLQYALALRSAVIYVLGICSVPLLFPCTDSPEAPLTSWASCPKSPYSFIPTNLMHIFHILPFWYAFLVTPYLGGLVKAIVDAILGVGLGLAAASLLNLLLPGGAAGPNYLAPEYFEQAWLPFRYSTFSAFMLALCFTYGLFVSSLSLGKKQYALGLFSELLVPFMSPTTRTGFRAVCWDWDFAWNWNGAAMCGPMVAQTTPVRLWLVLLAVLLSVFTLGLLPHRRSIEMHTARWASALALAQLAEDTGGCLEYLMTILQQDAWKFQFHAESSNFYIKHLGLRLTRAEMILDLTPWEGGSDLTTVVAFLRQLRQLLRIQSEQMRYFGQTIPKGEQLKLVDFLQACNEGLALVASDCRSHADLTKESCAELQRIADKADEVLVQSLRSLAENDKRSMAFVDLLRSWPQAFRRLGERHEPRRTEEARVSTTWRDRHWFALRNTTSWTLALLYSLYFRDYNCGCVVATSYIFSQTSGSSFDVNINRLLGVCMGLAVGNIPALLILSDRTAVDPSSTSYLLRVFMYFVVMLITWTLAIFGYLAVDSKYCGACLNWAALSGVQMLRHLPRVSMLDVDLFTAILDNVMSVMVVFLVDMVFAYMQGNSASEQVKAAVTECIQRISTLMSTLKADGIGDLELDALQKSIKEARFWESEIQKEGLVWTRLWQNAYKAESVPTFLDHFDEVYVWLNALQNSSTRCDREWGGKIVKKLLPKSEVDRCQTFVRAVKLVLQGLDDSLHELHHLLEGSKKEANLEPMSSQSICNVLQGETEEGPAPLDDVSPVDGRSPGSTADALEQRAAAEALSLSAKALRMTLQKIGGLLAAGSALAAKDWGVEARVRNGSGLQSSSMEEFMPSGKTTELRRRLRSSQSTTF
ncbi:unnamed protein product [Durusdinium trenchii]|uniref:Uncharacterized protein n=1 Tax=Durusdinium trenchii TaxID=1381693 RepID=A0ABP0SIY8_9DINO